MTQRGENTIIYVRVSDPKQVDGTSLESQELACHEYARAHKLGILKVFIEEGESAKFADRTELLKAIDFCKAKRNAVGVLLVWKLDRFSRNVADHFHLKAHLAKYGVQIISATEPIDESPQGKLMETVLAGFGQFDNDLRALRCVGGMKHKIVEDGLWPWKPPIGYVTVTKPGEKKTEPDTPDPKSFDVLREAWVKFSTGAYSQAAIRRWLSTFGVHISKQGISQTFANPYYAGLLINPWDKTEHEGRHPPMVTREVFARVQRIRAGSGQVVPHVKLRPEFPLRGIARCPRCEHCLTGGFSRGNHRRYPYYRCRNSKCSRETKSLRTELVHSEFESLLDSIAPNSSLMPAFSQHVLAVAAKQASFFDKRQHRWKAILRTVSKERQELIRMRAQSLITDEEFLAQKKVLWKKQMGLEASPPDQRPDMARLRDELDAVVEPLLDLKATWKALPLDVTRVFARCIVPMGFVHTKSRTPELGPLFAAIDDFRNRKSTGVHPARPKLNTILRDIRTLLRLFRASGEATEETEEGVRLESWD